MSNHSMTKLRYLRYKVRKRSVHLPILVDPNKMNHKMWSWGVTGQVWDSGYEEPKLISFIIEKVNKNVILNSNINKDLTRPDCCFIFNLHS